MSTQPAQTTPWEDHLLERKTSRDLGDIRRTATAFANSVMPGHTAVILIGEGNDGRVSGVPNPDEQQRRIRSELEKVYPPIVWKQRLYEKEGLTCIRIEIEPSGSTPHFADAAFIRIGSESVKASEAMLQKLIDLRDAKIRELTKWTGKLISVSWAAGYVSSFPNWGKTACEVQDVTSFYTTFKVQSPAMDRSEPHDWLELSWDDAERRLRVFVNPDRSQWR